MIWLVGQNGMLGRQLALELGSRGLEFVGSDREVDITDYAALVEFSGKRRFDWIVNCAAYTAVDKAETESDLAAALNMDGPRNLARLSGEIGAGILHISTDYVFSGKADRPYAEDAPVDPQGVYGRTKAEGEKAVLAACGRSVILRTAWLYGKYGPNFVYTMLRLMRQKPEIKVVHDQRGTPTWAAALARAIVSIVQSDRPSYGIYHYTDGGETSWYDFALEIHRLARELGLLDWDCGIRAIPSSEYPTPASRPNNSVLSKDKIVKQYGIELQPWQLSLGSFMKELAVELHDLKSRDPGADPDSVLRAARASISNSSGSTQEKGIQT